MSDVICMKDIVIVAVQDWDFEIGSNARNIALEFAKNHRVLYVNPPLDWISRIRNSRDSRVRRYVNVIRGRQAGLRKISNNLWNLTPNFTASSINWIRINFMHDWLNRRTNEMFAKSIENAVKELGFESYIIFNDNLIFKGMYLKEMLRPLKYIYYIRDYLVIQPYFKKHGKRLEPQLMGKVDIVVANSPYLKDYGGEYNSNSFYVGQGCEIEMFDEDLINEVPSDIVNLRGPLIGYVGFLTSMRLDIDLLCELALKNPDWNIVLVGPEDDIFKKSELHSIKNVYFLGKKSPEKLAAYVKSFDVCINPQLVNQLTIGNYPRKVDEYLAMGKPVVATKTQAMEIFANHTYLAANFDEFINLVKQALNGDNTISKAERKSFAKSHTWEESVNEIYKAIASVNS
jgi:glycosyltransferase involved in cell wall biosynthesis